MKTAYWIGAYMCLAVSCVTQKPRPCSKCEKWQKTSQNEDFMIYAQYSYDALGKRIRLQKTMNSANETTHTDALLLFRKHTVYLINHDEQSCKKKRMNSTFHPLEVPKQASFLSQIVLGSLSGPGEGLLVNNWYGESPCKKVKYLMTVTEFGCLPVGVHYRTNRTGLITFFNIARGIKDPGVFIPPSFCEDADVDVSDDSEDFYSIFITCFKN
uniref:Ependymin n=1 Tax=Denticeps clupeoides TaxID=299321 RepID=A0AAY4A8F4_9TELE